jgi:hypothetical protein
MTIIDAVLWTLLAAILLVGAGLIGAMWWLLVTLGVVV